MAPSFCNWVPNSQPFGCLRKQYTQHLQFAPRENLAAYLCWRCCRASMTSIVMDAKNVANISLVSNLQSYMVN